MPHPYLTAKQEGFAMDVASGMNLSDAYRNNYDVKHWKPESIWESACVLSKNPKVLSRINILKQELLKEKVKTTVLSRDYILTGLMETIEEARLLKTITDRDGRPVSDQKQNLAAAVRSYELLGKELGMFVERKEIRTGKLEDMTIAELEARAMELSRELGLSGGLTQSTPKISH